MLSVLALAAVGTIAWAAGRARRLGRHQRSPLGPIRGDGSGWTKEGVAQFGAGSELSRFTGYTEFRGPEDDPDFLDQLTRLNRSKRPEPPAEA